MKNQMKRTLFDFISVALSFILVSGIVFGTGVLSIHASDTVTVPQLNNARNTLNMEITVFENARTFAGVPPTGVADIAPGVVAMLVLFVASAVLWGVVLLRKRTCRIAKNMLCLFMVLVLIANISSVQAFGNMESAEMPSIVLTEDAELLQLGFSPTSSDDFFEAATSLQGRINHAKVLLAETDVGTALTPGSFNRYFAPQAAHDALIAAIAIAQGVLNTASVDLITPVPIAGGGNHSVAIYGGMVWTWGANGSGQLGDGSLNDSRVPVMVRNIYDIAAVSAGTLHTLALRNDGTVWAWGNNESGVLGNGTNIRSAVPVQVRNLSNIVSISAGGNHSLALRSDGTVWAWGHNGFGRLGDGTTTNRHAPVRVPNLYNVTAIAAGDTHSAALRSDGTVWSWGRNNQGQLGIGNTENSFVPVQVQGLGSAVAIEAGAPGLDGDHTIALLADGMVWAWGRNGNRQLGDGSQVTNRLTPVQVINISNVDSIGSGRNHSFAIRADGIAMAWGSNLFGQLGRNSVGTQTVLGQVQNLTNVTAITGGGAHSLARTADGTIWAWGDNSNGQIGDNTVTRRLLPVRVGDFEEPPEYEIIISSTTGGTATASRNSAASGTTITITATPAQNYRFVRWEVVSGFANIVTPTSPNRTFVMRNSDVEIHAVFAPSVWPINHTVMVSAVGSGSVTSSHAAAQAGAQVGITAAPDTGHEFVRWEVVEGGITIANASNPHLAFTMPNEPVIIRAVFGIPGISITGLTLQPPIGMQAGRHSSSRFSVTMQAPPGSPTTYYVTLNNAPAGMTPHMEPGVLSTTFSTTLGLNIWVNGATDGVVFSHGGYMISMTLWCRDTGNHVATSDDFMATVPARSATVGVTIRSARADSPEAAQLILRCRATPEERLDGNTRNGVNVLHDQYSLHESWYRVHLPAGENFINVNPGGTGTARYADVAIFSANDMRDVFSEQFRRPDLSPFNFTVSEPFIAPSAGYYFIRITGDSPPGIGQNITWSVGYRANIF